MTTLNEAAVDLEAKDFLRFQELAYRHAGIRLAEGKQSLVQNRLQRRLREAGVATFGAYHELVSRPDQTDELQQCIEALTTNETFFFRHHTHWDLFIKQVLAAHPAHEPLRIWSAAASTGEEAHSAAIACLEHAPNLRVSIEGSDINQRVLDAAKRGVYGDYALQKLSAYARERWLTAVDGGWQVQARARNLISWRRHNLLDAAPGAKHHVVFLRNVLIYFDEASKMRVLANVAARMQPGAWLFLGGSEALPPSATGFTAIRPQIYRKS